VVFIEKICLYYYELKRPKVFFIIFLKKGFFFKVGKMIEPRLKYKILRPIWITSDEDRVFVIVAKTVNVYNFTIYIYIYIL
jgi:hypothetical protein